MKRPSPENRCAGIPSPTRQEDPKSATRTLVVHTGGIGDFLLACPAISALRTDDTLDLCGYPDRLRLAVRAGIAGRAMSIDSVDFHTAFDRPSPRLHAFLAHYERVIVFMRDAESLRASLHACGVPVVDVHPGLPPRDWTRHASEYYAERLNVHLPGRWQLGIPPRGTPLDVVIHPGSGSPNKNWSLENFVHLATALRAGRRHVTWIRGPAEIESQPEPEPGAPVLVESALDALAARVATARLYVGNDSGVTHLAAALGVRTVAIFGPTDPDVWAPRGTHVRVVKGNPWPTARQAIDTVSALIDGFEKTSPETPRLPEEQEERR